MDIRFKSKGSDIRVDLADHARRRLEYRLMHRRDEVDHIAVRLGDTGSRRGLQDSYCVLRVQMRGFPASTVVDVGADAFATIDRAADRVGHLVEAQLRGSARR